MKMKIDHHQIRAALMKELKLMAATKPEELHRHTLVEKVRHSLLADRQITVEEFRGCGYELGREAEEFLQELLARGVLIYNLDAQDPVKYQAFRLTRFGVIALAADEPTAYDPSGYMAHYDVLCADADADVRSFLAAALSNFTAIDPALSAIYLAAASERLVDALSEAVATAMDDGNGAKELRKAFECRQIEQRFNALHKPLKSIADRRDGFPDTTEHKSTVLRFLPVGFDMIRCTRNDAGHPIMPGAVSKEALYFNLQVFPNYSQRVLALIEFFRATRITGK